MYYKNRNTRKTRQRQWESLEGRSLMANDFGLAFDAPDQVNADVCVACADTTLENLPEKRLVGTHGHVEFFIQGETYIIEAGDQAARFSLAGVPTGIRKIEFHGSQFDDVFANDTNIPADIYGMGGNDNLIGGSAVDRVWGGAGNDLIFGAGGADELHGGAGDDKIYGDNSQDWSPQSWQSNQAGSDKIWGNGGHDKIFAGLGQDEILGGDGHDFMDPGFDGARVVDGGRGYDFRADQWSIGEYSIHDVMQGNAGTCGRLSVLGSMALRGTDMTNRIRHLGEGQYQVGLFVPQHHPNSHWSASDEMTWVDVEFDGTNWDKTGPLTVKRQIDSSDAQPTVEGEFWTTLVDKAYWNEYYQLYRLDSSPVMAAYSGKEVRYYGLNSGSDTEHQNRIESAISHGEHLILGTAGDTNKLVGGHSYTIVSLERDGSDVRVTVRNPHGWDASRVRDNNPGDSFVTLTWAEFKQASGYHVTSSVRADIRGTDDVVSDTVIDSQGRIIVAGTTFYDNGDRDFVVARYLPDGLLDKSFGGGDGKVIVAFDDGGSDADWGNAVAVDSYDRILVGGSVMTYDDYDFAVARLTTSGNLDSSFGVGGKVKVPFDMGGADDDTLSDLAIDSQGRVLLGGTLQRSSAGDRDFGFARLDANGRLDQSFGNRGKAIVHFDRGGQSEDALSAIAVDSADRVVAVGRVQMGTQDYDFGITRLNVSGSLDYSFGTNGKTTVAFDLGHSNRDTAEAVQLDSHGRIVVGGTVTRSSVDSDFGVVRLEASGRLDTSFGSGGKSLVWFDRGLDNKVDILRDLAIDDDGRIVLSGTINTSQDSHMNWDFAVARLAANGRLDTSFGTNGKTTGFFNYDRSGNEDVGGLALDSLGRIILGCSMSNGDDSDLGIATVRNS